MFFEQNRAGRTTVAGTESSDWDTEVKSGRSEEKLAFTLQGRKSLQDATHPFLLFIFQEIARNDILLGFFPTISIGEKSVAPADACRLGRRVQKFHGSHIRGRDPWPIMEKDSRKKKN